MDSIFPLEKNFCKIFKEKNNPEYEITPLPKYLSSSISKYSIEFAKEIYFKLRLCFLHEQTNHLFYFNFPNIEVVDDYSVLTLLKIYRLYEMKGMKIVNYHSPKKSNVIFNPNVDFEKLSRYCLILAIADNIPNSLLLTEDDLFIIKILKSSYVLDFENPNNIDDIFNNYLRFDIVTEDFYRTKLIGKKRVFMEKAIREYFHKLKKNDPNYIENTRKEFKLEFDSLMEKLHKYYKTEEYKKFQKGLVIKSFRFPMKEYFGKTKPIQYECFKTLVDKFEEEVREKLSHKK